MPAEGERLRRRLGRRDRLFIGLVVVLAVVGVAVALLVGKGAQSNAGCVVYSHPNFTGGATYRYCGPKARPFCLRSAAARGPGVIAQCERLGLPVRRSPAGDGG
jgi:hypothetical protein